SSPSNNAYALTGNGHGRFNAGGVRGIGSGTGYGGRFTGKGDGSGVDNIAVRLDQNLLLDAVVPAASVAIRNQITQKNFCKAWGVISCDNPSPTLIEGFNVSGVAYD